MRASLVVAALGATLLVHGTVLAEDSKTGSKATTDAVETNPTGRERIVVDDGPNRLLLATGFVTLGFAYGISAYVAVGTEHGSEKWLFVPIAGPWVALARREDCGDRCNVEGASRALLVADGIVQLAGVAQIAAAFVTRELKERERPIIVPMRVEGGAGVSAVGTF